MNRSVRSMFMHRSIRNFNIPPGIPRAFDYASYPGRGEFERCVGRMGNLNRTYLLFWHLNTSVSFFRFLQSLMDLQDRILPLLGKNVFKRVFKTSLKVSLRYISPWKACEVFDWRENLYLRRGSSVLIGGTFERLFSPRGGNLNKPIFKTYAQEVAPGGGDVELSNWSAH